MLEMYLQEVCARMNMTGNPAICVRKVLRSPLTGKRVRVTETDRPETKQDRQTEGGGDTRLGASRVHPAVVVGLQLQQVDHCGGGVLQRAVLAAKHLGVI